MTSALLCFASTFVAVFALGLQSLNVNQGHYWAAAGTSLLIGLGHIALYKFMPGANAADIVGYLAGGVTGITSSMWFHRRFKTWLTEALARRRLRQTIKRVQRDCPPRPNPAAPAAGWPGDIH